MSGVQLIEVQPGEGDQRIDRWLRRRFPQLSQGRIEKMCRKGELRLDGGRVKPATRVAEGQSVACAAHSRRIGNTGARGNGGQRN